MAFLSRFFQSTPKQVLPTLEEILGARNLPVGPARAGAAPGGISPSGRRGACPLGRCRPGTDGPRLAAAAPVGRGPVPSGPAAGAQLEGRAGRLLLPPLPGGAGPAHGGVRPDHARPLADPLGRHLGGPAGPQHGPVAGAFPALPLPAPAQRHLPGRLPDGHSAARFLLPELWRGLFPGQNIFLAIPSEDELYVAPQVLLPQLVETITQIPGRPRPPAHGHHLPAGGRPLPARQPPGSPSHRPAPAGAAPGGPAGSLPGPGGQPGCGPGGAGAGGPDPFPTGPLGELHHSGGKAGRCCCRKPTWWVS